MKRYRLPAGTTPGNIPTNIVAHRDPSMTNTYMALHALASLQGDSGPFTSSQLLERMPPRKGEPPRSVAALDEELLRLAEFGYIDVEYLA
jgi:hypothetical protein